MWGGQLLKRIVLYSFGATARWSISLTGFWGVIAQACLDRSGRARVRSRLEKDPPSNAGWAGQSRHSVVSRSEVRRGTIRMPRIELLTDKVSEVALRRIKGQLDFL